MENTERSKHLHEMPFAEFAAAVRPSGASNKLPQIGAADPVVSYSVYLNGRAADALPGSAKEHHFDGLMVRALTEKVGLDPNLFRDNLKVAELVATRSAWMAAILDSSRGNAIDRAAGRFQAPALSAEVERDYEQLAQGAGLGHPWMQAQIRMQKAMSQSLRPALEAAEQAIGGAIRERIPGEVETGKVVSQNLDFTVQEVGQGEVVAHENRRLEVVPEVGKSITVSYYRGQGQVIENTREAAVSQPYVDQTSGDLALNVISKNGDVREVLFNSLSSFAQFVEQHQFDRTMVERAIEAREASPKPPPAPQITYREQASELYYDQRSGAVALDYIENGRKHTVMFGDAEAAAKKANEYGLSDRQVRQAEVLYKAKAAAEKEFPGNVARQVEFIGKVGREILTQDAGKETAAAAREQSAEKRIGKDLDRGR